MDKVQQNGTYNHKPYHIDQQWKIVHGGDHSKRLSGQAETNKRLRQLRELFWGLLLLGIGLFVAYLFGWDLF